MAARLLNGVETFCEVCGAREKWAAGVLSSGINWDMMRSHWLFGASTQQA